MELRPAELVATAIHSQDLPMPRDALNHKRPPVRDELEAGEHVHGQRSEGRTLMKMVEIATNMLDEDMKRRVIPIFSQSESDTVKARTWTTVASATRPSPSRIPSTVKRRVIMMHWRSDRDHNQYTTHRK